MSVPRAVQRLAVAGFLAGYRAADLLTLLPSAEAARFCARAGLSQQEYLQAVQWIASYFVLQHHAELRRGANIAASAEHAALLEEALP